LIAPRGSGPVSWPDPAPYYFRRSLPLLGRTAETCALIDVLAVTAQALNSGSSGQWRIVGRGPSGVIAAFAALLETRLNGVMTVQPPVSHRDGPAFLNVLRVIDVPAALGMLAPRPLTVVTSEVAKFGQTQSLYQIAGGVLTWVDPGVDPVEGRQPK